MVLGSEVVLLLVSTICHLNQRDDDVAWIHNRALNAVKIDLSSRECKIDTLTQQLEQSEKDVDVHHAHIREIRDKIEKVKKLVVSRADKIGELQSEKNMFIQQKSDYLHILQQAEDGREELRKVKRDYVKLEKARDRHILSCPATDSSVTSVETQFSVLDHQRAQLEQTQNSVLASFSGIQFFLGCSFRTFPVFSLYVPYYFLQRLTVVYWKWRSKCWN